MFPTSGKEHVTLGPSNRGCFVKNKPTNVFETNGNDGARTYPAGTRRDREAGLPRARPVHGTRTC